jgi:hypothetical protein
MINYELGITNYELFGEGWGCGLGVIILYQFVIVNS